MQRRVVLLICAMALMVVCGCDSTKKPKWPDPVPVSGTVTYDDKPLNDAMVTFMPIQPTPGQGASGITDASGKYKLESRTVDGKTTPGAIPGNYGIRVSRMIKPDGSVWKPDPNVGPNTFGGREELPDDYSLKTTLKADVAKDKGVHDFKLDSKKAKKKRN